MERHCARSPQPAIGDLPASDLALQARTTAASDQVRSWPHSWPGVAWQPATSAPQFPRRIDLFGLKWVYRRSLSRLIRLWRCCSAFVKNDCLRSAIASRLSDMQKGEQGYAHEKRQQSDARL